ncbi:thaumatin-like protein 1 [Cornus florida]|uniref:thaumatin-like protein 1 n=1 Tax=Cornus florida TaxID=4283 RepID=UPI0028978976|nr:thaumatin-like protein 1 [Cornus florida]
MDMSSALIFSISFHLLLLSRGVLGATFTFVNKCEYTVWPGILANAGTPTLDTTGFELPQHTSRSFQAPTGWSGRFWGRTGCNFDQTGSGSCNTADCGSGQVECNGAGAAPPATLAEFSLGTGGQDFYDVSLVDGYNIPLLVEASGGSGMCASTGCLEDLNRQCPVELRFGDGEACRSACEVFGSPEYCCSGAYNSPAACKPSVYSEMFKSACPRSYSYAYDDPTSTFTCTGADYTMTFCPSMPSQKSSKDSSSGTTTAGLGSGSDMTVSDSGSGSEAILADGSWLAGLAMGHSTRALSATALHFALTASSTLSLILSLLYL